MPLKENPKTASKATLKSARADLFGAGGQAAHRQTPRVPRVPKTEAFWRYDWIPKNLTKSPKNLTKTKNLSRYDSWKTRKKSKNKQTKWSLDWSMGRSQGFPTYQICNGFSLDWTLPNVFFWGEMGSQFLFQDAIGGILDLDIPWCFCSKDIPTKWWWTMVIYPMRSNP